MAIEMLRVGKCGSGSAPVRLIKGDNNTQLIQMQVQRYFGGVDLSTLAWSVTVENAKGATDEYYVAHRSGEYVIDIEWIVKGTATAAAGLTKFKLSGFGGDNALVWQSGTYFIRVEDTIEYVPGSETETALTDVQKLIVYVDGELKNVIAAGNDARTWANAANAAAQRAENAASLASGAAESASSAAVSAGAAAEAANAASNVITNEFKGLVDRLTTPFTETGSIVTCYPVEGYPLEVKTYLAPEQVDSDGYTGAKLMRCGRNIAPYAVPESEFGITISPIEHGFRILGTATYGYNKVIHKSNQWLLAGTYTLSARLNGSVTGSGGVNVYINADGKMYPLWKNGPLSGVYSYTFILPDDTYDWSLRVACDSGTTYDVSVSHIQLELGSNATEYEPYHGETFSVDFGQTVYGGVLDWNTGLLTVDEMHMIQLTPTQILALKGENNLWSDAGETEVQGAIDPEYLTNITAGEVLSINGKTGHVRLSASDVGALPADTEIPAVPGKVSAFENDAGYLTKVPDEYVTDEELNKKGYLTEHQDLSAYAKRSEIPDVSAFITRAVSDLANYYRKSETYTRNEIDQRISTIPKFSIEVVSSLPVTGISETTIYLVSGGTGGNLYTEYIFVNGAWEVLGSQRVDLTGYATQSWTLAQLAGYQPKGNYLTKVPDEYITETELAAKGYLTQHQDISGKLDADKLPEAVNIALEQAKASGEFDGAPGADGKDGSPGTDGKDGAAGADGVSPTVSVSKSGKVTTISITDKNGTKTATINDGADGQPGKDGQNGSPGSNGKDGTSVTVKSVSESTADGGSNVVTFSDGKMLTVKNGSKGSTGATGATGAAGKTPVKYVDYWTVADREQIVQDVIAALGTPVFGRVDADNNIILTGELAEGTYTVKYEDAEGNVTEIGTLDNAGVPEPAYTNLANPADSNWLVGKRINSSKQVVDWAGGVITNYFDVSSCKEYIHVKGIDLLQGNSRYYKYNEVGGALQDGTNIGASGHVTTAAYDPDVMLIPASDIISAKIWRLGGLLTGTSADVIITIDEEIK